MSLLVGFNEPHCALLVPNWTKKSAAQTRQTTLDGPLVGRQITLDGPLGTLPAIARLASFVSRAFNALF